MTVTDLTAPSRVTSLSPLADPADLSDAAAWRASSTQVHEECLSGFTAWKAMAFPTPLGWAATFDPGLVHELAAAVARSMTDVGVHHGLAPVPDVCHDPRWGRTEETLGQDTHLAGVLAAAYTAGLESGGIVVSPEHRPAFGVQRLRAPVPDSPWLRSLAARMAERSIVLVDNASGLLPLPAPASVAVVGPCAHEWRSLVASQAFPHHLGAQRPGGAGIHVDTLLQALRQEWPQAQITHAAGVPAQRADTSEVAAAADLAAAAEVCVLAVGDVSGPYGRGTSGAGCDADDLRLPGAQHELVEAVLATGTPTVLVLLSGRPYAVGEYVGRAAAVVQAFFPGQLGAQAVAGVLSGLVNPSGHLPVELPEAGYAFGHGLSYARFRLSDLTVDADGLPGDGQVTVRLLVSNVGDRRGEDVVQLYVDGGLDGGTSPRRQLVGFARVPLAAGQTRTVTFSVPTDRMSGVVELRAADTSGTAQDGPATSFRVVGPPRSREPVRSLGAPAVIG